MKGSALTRTCFVRLAACVALAVAVFRADFRMPLVMVGWGGANIRRGGARDFGGYQQPRVFKDIETAVASERSLQRP